MKKIALLALCFAAMHVSASATAIDIPREPGESSPQEVNVVNVCDLTEQDLNEIMQGLRPQLAVEFSAHTALPVSFFLNGNLANLIQNEGSFGQIEIQQTFYVRCVEKELILSSNLTEWTPFIDFITGTASIVLNIQDGKPSIKIGAEANRSN